MSQGGEDRVHRRQGNSEFVSWETSNVDYASEKNKSLQVRYMYGIIFLSTNLVAWFIRDYGQRTIPQLHYLKSCGAGGQDCFHTLGVLRVSLGCFIFFFLMFLSTSRTRKLHEPRNAWHSRWWSLKFIVFIVSMVVPFFFPPALIQLYGELARVGAGIFLLLQLVSVIQFISWWNKYWMPDEKTKQSCSLGLFTSTIFYIASFCGVGLMYSLYVPKVRCVLNIFFISWTLILLIVMMVVSLHSKVNRGLLSSGIMASYVVFLCWSAIRSEPATDKCSARKQESGNSDWITILSFLIAICAVVMATFSTGIDSQSFQFRKDKVKEVDDIRYKYGFFHLIFSLGAMYFAMLFISWNLNNSATKWSMDVGWASTWVKIVNEWFAATIYLWTLISPVVRQAKVRDHEEQTVQEANDSSIA
ncbi:serine incorporator 3 isoform X1 [Momordica charantia]|uniref:Serine incorporator 3 isoform X1 n=2 Tax=Momordica charantia TaxID=3673 RepID=A0A6J1DUG6_MOMCH|nr:serine incorporator 3 isoform X1 [Momordica charantia]